MKNLLYLLLGSLLSLTSCESSECGQEVVVGILHNATGFDGCGWLIKLTDGTNLEPTNLSEFVSDPEEELTISFTYEINTEAMSICMVGDIIQITCVESTTLN